MPRRHASLLALVAALALAPPAHAKQIDALTVCGADGCQRADRAIGQALHGLGGAALATAPRPAPYFRLVMRIGDGRRTFGIDRLVYVPSSRTFGGNGGWSRLDRGTAAKLARALAKRRPLPAAKLAGAAGAEHGASLPPEVVLPPSGTARRASSDAADVGWLAGGGALAAILGLGLWKLRRGRLAAAGR
jgi:hypothetical protein